MTAHTPGPWTVHDHAPWSVWTGDTQIASCRWYDEPMVLGAYCEGDSERAQANARLIAAAPELLAALDTVVGQVWDLDVYGEEEMRARMRRIGQLARAAIAKAVSGRQSDSLPTGGA